MTRVTLALLLLWGLPAEVSQSVTAQPTAQWWILNGPRATIVDDSLKPLGEPEIGLNPRVPISSPDGRHIAVASAGALTSRVPLGRALFSAPQNVRREFWPEAGSTSTVTVFNSGTLEVAGRQTVRFRPVFLKFTDSDTLVVVSAGQVSSNTQKQILPAIAILNIPDGKIRQQVDLQAPPFSFWYDEGTRLLHIACEKFGNRAAELVTLDPATGSVRRTPLPSDVFDWHVTGDPNTRYLELADGVVVVTAKGELAQPIRAGKEKLFFTTMPGSTRYLLAGKTGKQATLLVLDSGRVTKQLDLDKIERVIIGSKTPRIIVCGDKTGVVLDRETFAETRRLALPGDYIDVLLDPSERNLYVYRGGSVVVIDIEQNRQIANFGVGSGLKKFVASGTGYMYREGPVVRQALPSDEARPVFTMAFSPSGSHLFAYNAAAEDVTIVDTATHTSKQKIGVGQAVRQAVLWQMPAGRQLVAFKGKKIIVFDTETGRVLTEKEFPDSLIAWNERLNAIFVRTAAGTVAYRTDSLEMTQDFGAEFAITKQAIDDNRDGVFFFGSERRFVMTKATGGVRMYDYDLKSIGDFGGVTRVEGVMRLAPLPAESGK